jgi:hypothetical protein
MSKKYREDLAGYEQENTPVEPVVTEPVMPTYDWNPTPYQRGQYQSEYADLIKAAADRVSNWNYDPANDSSYRSYARQYAKAGANAYEDTLARVASRTGGVASSYAVSAAQQQYNKYMSDLAAKVPELEQLAYQRAQNDLNMYAGLDNTAYGRWNDDEERRYKAWAANQSAAQSAYNQRYNAEMDKYNDYLSRLAEEKSAANTQKDFSTYIKNAKEMGDYRSAKNYLLSVAQANGLSDAEVYNMLLEAKYDPQNEINYEYAEPYTRWGFGRQEEPSEAYRRGDINENTYNYILRMREENRKKLLKDE